MLVGQGPNWGCSAKKKSALSEIKPPSLKTEVVIICSVVRIITNIRSMGTRTHKFSEDHTTSVFFRTLQCL
jgi:hypothetical protein